jgi:hypothetical protein
MKTILLITTIIFTATARADEQVISTFSWKELADAGKLAAGTFTGAPDNALKVENRASDAMNATVLTIVQPKITTDFYALTGEVRYDNVEGDGFLEMWSHFGEQAAYFSRTLGVAGPMAKLTGTSDWRAFTLVRRQGRELAAKQAGGERPPSGQRQRLSAESQARPEHEL